MSSANNSIEKSQSIKRKRIDVETKVALIQQSKDGKSVNELCSIHGLKPDTVRNILRHQEHLKENITKFDYPSMCQARKALKFSEVHILDTALSKWFYQARAKNVPISYSIIQAQAVRINEMLGEHSQPNFKASNGFIHRFLHRHGFNDTKRLNGERISADPESAEDFKQVLKNYIKEHDLCAEQVFNCDESGLMYKCLPNTSLTTQDERNPSNMKELKDRVSILLCANASGNFRLPLTFIHKFKTPHRLRNINKENLPVHYYVRASAWMDATIFFEWFKQRFVPLVREFLISKQLPPKAVLILDNAPVIRHN
jgi:hypothetical protein